MKKILSIIVFLVSALTVMAVPVRRGQWTTITLTNGQSVKAEARGDEWARYWVDADGQCYAKNPTSGLYESVLPSQVASFSKARRARRTAVAQAKAWGRRAPGMKTSPYVGKKRGLIILVEFSDLTFKSTNNSALYTRIANEPNFREDYFNGSVRDYFLAQSNQQFDLSFDVAGPVKLPQKYAYYGADEDTMMGELVHDVCVAVDKSINFADYDWDGDKEVDQVFIIYAGFGEADHTEEPDYIWPHQFWLTGFKQYKNSPLVLDGTKIDTYACANELVDEGTINGIGTICHEFSHCLGLPDMYDTGDSNNFGMGSWDLMDYGCYNGSGFTPSGYTGYERMACGWQMPVELKADMQVTGMKALSSQGESYVLYHPDNRNEYYILDNRQNEGFDQELPGHGLLITHVDFDQEIWDNNLVNATGKDSLSGIENTHQRATIFHADNRDDAYSESGDTYPYRTNNSLTALSKPKATLHNATASGAKVMKLGIVDIREDLDGTISFAVKDMEVPGEGNGGTTDPDGTLLLNETFDKCAGNGGNDGVFGGSVASAAFTPDLEGWTTNSSAYGGDRCARFGKSSGLPGEVTSPAFTMPGDTLTLEFRAAGWNAKADGTELRIVLNGANAKFVDGDSPEKLLTMEKGKWTTYKLKLVGTGNATITFSPSKRFFLDDVTVSKPVATAIRPIVSDANRLRHDGFYYTLDGRRAGTNWNALPRGVYVVGGKKVVKTW